jgi:hypothetical protein
MIGVEVLTLSAPRRFVSVADKFLLYSVNSKGFSGSEICTIMMCCCSPTMQLTLCIRIDDVRAPMSSRGHGHGNACS